MKTPVSQTLDNCFAKMANAMSKQNTYNNCLYISLNAYRGRGVSYNLATTLHTRLSEINASSETKEQIKQSQKLFEGSYFKKAQHGFVLLDKASSALPSLLDDLLGEKQHWSSKQRQKLKSLEDIMTMASSGEKEHEHIRLFVASPQAVNSPQKTESTYKNWQQALTTTPTAQTCYRFEYWATPASGGGSCQTHKTLYATTVDDLITRVALFLIEKNRFTPNDLNIFPLHEEMILEKTPTLPFSSPRDQKVWELALCQRTKDLLEQNLATKLTLTPKKGLRKL